MFTQRSALLGFVAFCFYLIAVVNSLSGFYYALTWLSMAMLMASLGVALLSLIGLECELEMTRSRGAAPLGEVDGIGALMAIKVSNAGTLNKTNVILEVRVQDAAQIVQTLRFLLESVPSGATIESVLPLSRLRRGKYELRDARLLGSDVLGLFRRQKRVKCCIDQNQSLIIGPTILKSEFSLPGGANGFVAGPQRALMARHGDELRSTRPYAPGDDLRHVHWKSSARAGELVVKEWEQTAQSSALVIWDGAAQTSWGTGDFNSTEWGLILAASFCHSLLRDGTPCHFVRLDSKPLMVESRNLLGGELPPLLTDALSGANASRSISLESAMQEMPALVSNLNSKIVIISASLGVDLVRGVSFLRTRGAQVQVFLIDAPSLAARSGDRRFQARVVKTPTQSDGTTNTAISAENFAIQVARLRELGASVVEVRAQSHESADACLRAALRAANPLSNLSKIEV